MMLTNPAQLTWGNLNLVGATNTIGLLNPNQILWGDVYYSSGGAIGWGQDVTSLEGKHLVWATALPSLTARAATTSCGASR